jgi:hypothetical protein
MGEADLVVQHGSTPCHCAGMLSLGGNMEVSKGMCSPMNFS